MKYTTALSLLFSGLAAAQSSATTTASSSSSSSTSLPDLVSDLPTCAATCLVTAASDIGCASADFTCLCQSQDRLVTSLTPCVLTAGCSTNEIAEAAKIAPQICSQVTNNADASAIASASNLLTGVLATATASSAATATASTTAGTTANAAVRRDYGLGMVGAAALAAVAAL